MKKVALHWQIIIGLLLGLAYGIASANYGWGDATSNWIAPLAQFLLIY